ncbi:DNA-binding protein YbaB [Saccharothrix ecbatanensis]|uniref:DNA-binding protein YbaB n=1 Tax=Saccharothrix ecbatanensis TaxID=1105145 RepID=A0A7W9M1D6_9PSEU|nr:YbaB/EbfC family nucleoid-associated protein [Saccharothrix ecbatanensis]MBB5803816.1 DNA-binding protein YbaB [Saccharothrix ecbatanensis]
MSGDDRARLEARNAAMKEQVNGLLDTFNRQAEMLREAQVAAAQTTASLTSKDGLVRASVDSSGVLTHLEFAPSAFERSTPEALARSVLQLAREGASQVKQQVNDLMSPLTEGLPDLSDLVEGAPSLSALLPRFDAPPPPATTDDTPFEDRSALAPQSPSSPPPPPAARRRPASADDEDLPDSWLKGSY